MNDMRQFLLDAHPVGRPIEDGDFRLVAVPVPRIGPGQALLKIRWLGFDPAQKGWMENFGDYVAPMAIGDVMRGTAIGEVVESNNPALSVGSLHSGMMGWSEYWVTDGHGLTPVDPALPPVAMLAFMGLTGMTAWHGLYEIGRPKAGDTVVVSGAAGATGSVVGQLARIAGCRVIGIAGGAEKCRWLTEEAGYDVAIDYREGAVGARLKEAAPNGVDVVFDNVGGATLDAMLEQIATGARVVLCGGISRYETGGLPAGPAHYFNLVMRRATMQGFIVLDHVDRFPAMRARLRDLALDGKLAWQVDEQIGFENAPATLRRLFEGKNRGKQVLRVA
jgi:NADPH-dependent curcumin reductase CurA